MYIYFEKVNIVFLYIMQHLDTSDIALTFKSLQIHVK